MLPPPPDQACKLDVGHLREQDVRRRLHRTPVPQPVNEQRIEADEAAAEEVICRMARKQRARNYAIAARVVGLVSEAGYSLDEADELVTRGKRPANRQTVRRAERASTVRPCR